MEPTPASLNLKITKGRSFFAQDLYFFTDPQKTAPANLTGYTLYAQVRDAEGNLVVNLAPAWVDASTGHARLPEMTPATTAAISADLGPGYVWDLIMNDASGRGYPAQVIGQVELAATISQAS